MTEQKMRWKVAIAGPTGAVYKETNAFKLLYPFPTLAEAEAHAKALRILGMKVAVSPTPTTCQT